MFTLRFFALFSIVLIGCNQSRENTTPAGSVDCIAPENVDTTGAATYRTVRGALLATRFGSFDELKSVIQIEYHGGDGTSNNAAFVRVRHCSSRREVISVLETGTSQGDIYKARYGGAFWDRINVLFRCPYAVANRKDMERIYTLSRRRPEWYGQGDPAFFDLAKSMVENINTPESGFRNTRDSTEKGYLNSFNHILAQAFITSCFSEKLADFIGDTHERYRHPELITGKFTVAQLADLEEGPVDNYVDIINNEWGQELGKQLKVKYGTNRETQWTPELLANYLNDMQRYFSWAFQLGFEPFRPEDEVVRLFSYKLAEVRKGRMESAQ
ncbi:MAG: hypothetical protein IT270_09925 [Saprospiraceae bacterium]|nr:hypothetical protein [Saprospiraceae bacterium]